MQGEILRYFRDFTWTVRPPRELQERAIRIERERDQLTSDLGRNPTARELAAHVGCTLEELLDASEAAHARSSDSFDRPVATQEDDAATLGERLGDEDPGFEAAEASATLDRLLTTLSERDQLVLRLRFREDLTQTEIGRRIGCSQMHVSRIQRAALAQLVQNATTAHASPTRLSTTPDTTSSGRKPRSRSGRTTAPPLRRQRPPPERSYFRPGRFGHVFGVVCRVRLALRPTISAEARSTADGAIHATRQRTNGDGIDCGAGFTGPLLFRPVAHSKRGKKQGATDGFRHGTQEARPLQASGGQRVASRPAASGRAREGRHGAPRRRGRPATRLALRSALPRATLGHFSTGDTRRTALWSLASRSTASTAGPVAPRADARRRRVPRCSYRLGRKQPSTRRDRVAWVRFQGRSRVNRAESGPAAHRRIAPASAYLQAIRAFPPASRASCHAEGRGFEPPQPLSQKARLCGPFVFQASGRRMTPEGCVAAGSAFGRFQRTLPLDGVSHERPEPEYCAPWRCRTGGQAANWFRWS